MKLLSSLLYFIGNTIKPLTDIDYSISDEEYTELENLISGGRTARIIDWVYPIGSVVASVNSDFNPNNLYKGQTWVRFAGGRTLVGYSSDEYSNEVLKTGGESTHKLTVEEMPRHRHNVNDVGNTLYVYSSLKSLASSISTSNPNYAIKLTRNGDGYTNASDDDFYRLMSHYTGNGYAHNNLQPYVTVYYWRRTA